MTSLIEKGKVEVLAHRPFIVNPLSVAVQRTKLRLILDCSFLNDYIEVPRFKYEDVVEGLNYFKKGCTMFNSSSPSKKLLSIVGLGFYNNNILYYIYIVYIA